MCIKYPNGDIQICNNVSDKCLEEVKDNEIKYHQVGDLFECIKCGLETMITCRYPEDDISEIGDQMCLHCICVAKYEVCECGKSLTPDDMEENTGYYICQRCMDLEALLNGAQIHNTVIQTYTQDNDENRSAGNE